MPKKSEPTARLRFVSSKLTNSTQPVIVLHWHLHNHWNKCTHEPPDFKRFTLFCVMHFAGSVTAQPYASYYSCSKSKRGTKFWPFPPLPFVSSFSCQVAGIAALPFQDQVIFCSLEHMSSKHAKNVDLKLYYGFFPTKSEPSHYYH